MLTGARACVLRARHARALTISWSFVSETKEISFGVFFNDGFDVDYRPSDLACLKPVAAYDAHVHEVRPASRARAWGVPRWLTRCPRTPANVRVARRQATGSVVVSAPGTYILRWVNTGAFKARTIRYLVS